MYECTGKAKVTGKTWKKIPFGWKERGERREGRGYLGYVCRYVKRKSPF